MERHLRILKKEEEEAEEEEEDDDDDDDDDDENGAQSQVVLVVVVVVVEEMNDRCEVIKGSRKIKGNENIIKSVLKCTHIIRYLAPV
ncbi:hypothetical protein LguiB_013811 [Lonicera macranthoides]